MEGLRRIQVLVHLRLQHRQTEIPGEKGNRVVIYLWHALWQIGVVQLHIARRQSEIAMVIIYTRRLPRPEAYILVK